MGIVELADHIPITYHIAFNHRKASADACAMIVEAACKIVSAPVAKAVDVA